MEIQLSPHLIITTEKSSFRGFQSIESQKHNKKVIYEFSIIDFFVIWHPIEKSYVEANKQNSSLSVRGEVLEWLNRLPWKGSILARVSRVRIPLSPLKNKENKFYNK